MRGKVGGKETRSFSSRLFRFWGRGGYQKVCRALSPLLGVILSHTEFLHGTIILGPPGVAKRLRHCEHLLAFELRRSRSRRPSRELEAYGLRAVGRGFVRVEHSAAGSREQHYTLHGDRNNDGSGPQPGLLREPSRELRWRHHNGFAARRSCWRPSCGGVQCHGPERSGLPDVVQTPRPRLHLCLARAWTGPGLRGRH